MTLYKAFWHKLQTSAFLGTIALAIIYFLLTVFSFSLTILTEFETIIYPSTGIALAFILLLGNRIFLGVFIGSFFGYWWTGDFSLEMANLLPWLLYSISATIQIVIGAWLVRRFNCYLHDFSNPKLNLKFYTIAGPITALIDSTIGLTISIYFNQTTMNTVIEDWLLWWIGDVTSILIFTSLILSLAKFNFRRKVIVSILLFLTFLLAEGVHAISHKWDTDRLNLILQQQTTAIAENITNSTQNYQIILDLMNGLRKNHNGITIESFQNFTDSILKHDPNILTLNWNAFVKQNELKDFNSDLNKLYNREIIIGEASTNPRVPSADKESYVVVQFIAPFDEYSKAIGSELSVSNTRKTAFDHSEKYKTPSITLPILLPQENETVVSMYLADFNNQELAGYSAVLLSMNKLLNDILLKPFSQDLDLFVSDININKGRTSLFRSSEGLENAVPDYQIEVPIFNRTWNVGSYKKPSFYERHSSALPFEVAFSSMIIACFIAVSVVNMSGQGIYLENLVSNRTKELEEANNTKTKFMANMSHDLRTPLNAIIGFSDIMKNELFGKLNNVKYSEYITSINSSSQYLLSLINDILDFSTLNANKRELKKVDLNILKMINHSLDTLYSLSDKKNIECKISVPKNMPEIQADEKALKQILINIISNAIKYTPSGGKIKVSASFDNSWISFVVKDNGEGINENDLKKIFIPFTRSESNPHVSHEGTGLGLSIVHSLVKLHDGEITLDSVLHKGTTVKIKFPRS